MNQNNTNYTVRLERRPNGEYLAAVWELPGCVSQGDSRDEAIRNIKEALDLYIEDCTAAGDPFVKREGLTFLDGESREPMPKDLLNHPSPELRQSLERAGFVYRREKGNLVVLLRADQFYSRVVIKKGLDRSAIDDFWNSLGTEEQQRIERTFRDEAPAHVREQYFAAQKDGGLRAKHARQELIDEYVQRAARARTNT
jgi:predicted RNase H-like HicB family nuclease